MYTQSKSDQVRTHCLVSGQTSFIKIVQNVRLDLPIRSSIHKYVFIFLTSSFNPIHLLYCSLVYLHCYRFTASVYHAYSVCKGYLPIQEKPAPSSYTPSRSHSTPWESFSPATKSICSLPVRNPASISVHSQFMKLSVESFSFLYCSLVYLQCCRFTASVYHSLLGLQRTSPYRKTCSFRIGCESNRFHFTAPDI